MYCLMCLPAFWRNLILPSSWLRISDDSSLSANHLFTVPSWYEVWGFLWWWKFGLWSYEIVILWRKGSLSSGWHPYLDFKMEVLFSCERLLTAYETSHCHGVEDHSLNFPLFYFLHVFLSISFHVGFRTWNENHVILINCNVCMPPFWVIFKEI
jgi:hypothetical protein